MLLAAVLNLFVSSTDVKRRLPDAFVASIDFAFCTTCIIAAFCTSSLARMSSFSVNLRPDDDAL